MKLHDEFVATQCMKFIHKRRTNYRRRPRIQNLQLAEVTQNVTEGTHVAQFPTCTTEAVEAGSQRVSLRTSERLYINYR